MFQLLLPCVVLAVTSAYEIGAPLTACESMYPMHNVSSQTSPPPFTITTNVTSYTKGQTIQVTLSAQNADEMDFEGFFLQARKPSEMVPIGSFMLPQGSTFTKTLTCPRGKGQNNAVTHSASEDTVEKIVHWKNPEGGHVVFVATMVSGLDKFWMNVRSPILTDVQGGPVPPTQAPGGNQVSGKTTQGPGDNQGLGQSTQAPGGKAVSLVASCVWPVLGLLAIISCL